ncbi:MAG: PKD domain-containing protein [Crocinitomicaceae bacterium]|nr:PKD domain-containing protein [Crocinitomicaceae bacterium]
MKNIFLPIVFIFLYCFEFSAQNSGVSINASGDSPDPSALLDLSSTTKGTLITRMTEGQRNAIMSPAIGLQIFNTTSGCFNFWTGTSWKQLCGDCDFNSPVASNSGPICEGNTLNLYATSIPGASYQWSGPNGYSSTQQNPVLSNATTGLTGTYSVSATLNGCTSPLQSTIATVYAIPAAPTAGSDSPICEGSSIHLTTPFMSGASYSWAGPNGYSATTQNPVITNSTSSEAGTYSVSVTINGCTSTSSSTSVTIVSLPVATFSYSPLTPVTGSAVSFDPDTNGAEYSWTFASGTPSTSSLEIPSVTWSSGGTFNVGLTVTAGGCSATTTTALTVQDIIVQTFLYTGEIVNWQVPSGVTSIDIEAWGAQGGSTNSYQGGLGAYIKGTFVVTPGQLLKVLVGGHGQNGSSGHGNCGGGGGGSFVSTASNSPMLIAGGGGGAGTAVSSAIGIPDSGQSGNSGSAGKGNGQPGGTSGNAAPGVCSGCGATNGAGFFTNSTAYGGSYGTAAAAFVNGGNGSSSNSGYFGGFGCAGAGAFGAGGGGGYSGGGSGNYTGGDDNSGGGGGGSYNNGTNQVNTSGVQAGDGQVVISY